MTRSERGRKTGFGRTVALYVAAAALAFAIGSSGVPGRAVALVAGWLADGGQIELVGPVGEAVRRVL